MGKNGYWWAEGKEAGDARAQGLSAMGVRRQAAILLKPDIDGTSSGFLLDSILPTLLK